MKSRRAVSRWMPPLLVLAFAGPAAITPPASASASGGTPLDGELFAVAATSATDAWAVGGYSTSTVGRALIEHWNGTQWCRVPIPEPGTSDGLDGVAAISATDAWAVGSYGTFKTLILHWNGTAWTKVPSPDPSSLGLNQLGAVAATSATDAWAVGRFGTSAGARVLILHWDGAAWIKVPAPTPGTFPQLTGVAATSASQAWAVGAHNTEQTLTLQWNGTAWRHVQSPNPASPPGDNGLNAVAATSGTDAWAVGVASKGSVNRNIALHWDGTTWHEVPVPEPDRFHDLLGVTATSASNAWAVGDYGTGTVFHTLMLQWNGMAWARVPSPSPGGPSGDDRLQAVAATSATNAWAVGSYDNGQAAGTLILHWDGTAWTQVPSP